MDHSSWAGYHTVFGRVFPEDMAVRCCMRRGHMALLHSRLPAAVLQIVQKIVDQSPYTCAWVFRVPEKTKKNVNPQSPYTCGWAGHNTGRATVIQSMRSCAA